MDALAITRRLGVDPRFLRGLYAGTIADATLLAWLYWIAAPTPDIRVRIPILVVLIGLGGWGELFLVGVSAGLVGLAIAGGWSRRAVLGVCSGALLSLVLFVSGEVARLIPAEYESPPRYDLLSGAMIVAAALLLVVRLLGRPHGSDSRLRPEPRIGRPFPSRIARTPSRAVVIATVIAWWAVQPALARNYYGSRFGNGAYPSNADSISLPIFESDLSWLYMTPVSVLLLWLFVRHYRAAQPYLVVDLTRPFGTALWTLGTALVVLVIWDFATYDLADGYPLLALAQLPGILAALWCRSSRCSPLLPSQPIRDIP